MRTCLFPYVMLAVTLLLVSRVDAAEPAEIRPQPVRFAPRDDVQHQRDLIFARYGERQLRLDLFSPRDQEHPRPAVVVVHGGGWTQGDRAKFHALAQALAARGYVTAAIEYRLAGEAKFPAAIHDVNAAIRWLRANAVSLRIDAQRIAAVGGSAGGHLVALAAAAPEVPALQGDGGNADQSSALQAAIAMAGPLDLTTGPIAQRSRQQPASNTNRWLGSTIDEDGKLYRLASPFTHLSATTPPLLLLTGELDQPSLNVASSRRLRALNVPTETIHYWNGKHGCWNQHPWFLPMVDDIAAFLGQTLDVEPPSDDSDPLSMPWGEIHRLADRVELRVNERPEQNELALPRWNNPVGRVYLKGDASFAPLTLKPGVAEWFITLPAASGDAIAAKQFTVVMETIGRPYLPTLPRIVPAADDGSVTLAAHDAVTHGELLRYEPQPHKNTVGYWANVDDWCEWTFYVERPGQFDLHVLQGCGKGHGGSRVAVLIGAERVEFTVEDTGHFQNFIDRRIGEVSLPSAGVYRLRIQPIEKAAGAVMDVRQMRLVSQDTPATSTP